MKGVLLSIALAGLGLLSVAADVPIQPDFDQQKFSGKWYPIAVVVDRGRLKDYVANAVTLEAGTKGKLIAHTEFPKKEKCRRKNYHLAATAQLGKYITPNNFTVRIMKTDYNTFSLFHSEKLQLQSLQLYAREPDVSDDLKEKFKKVVTCLGFPTDKILRIHLVAPCQEPKIT